MRKIYSGYCPNNHGCAYLEKPKKAKKTLKGYLKKERSRTMKVFAIKIDGQYFQELTDNPKYRKGSVGGTHSAFYHAHNATEFNLVTAPERRTFDKRTFKSYFAAVIDKIADKDISVKNLSVEIEDE